MRAFPGDGADRHPDRTGSDADVNERPQHHWLCHVHYPGYNILLGGPCKFCFSSIAGELRRLSTPELLEKRLIISGILSVQAGENPRIIEKKLHDLTAVPDMEILRPKIQDKIIGLLSAKTCTELMEPAVKQRLRDEIFLRVNGFLA